MNTQRTVFQATLVVGTLVSMAWAGPGATTWNFERDESGKAPSGFEFGLTAKVGKPGRWVVEAMKEGGGTKVLAQIDTDDTNARYPIAVASKMSFKNLRLTVRCKTVSGEIDQACGLVFRYKDQDNYYITRANALEDNVRLYTVNAGKRKQIATWDGKVAPKTWHTLSVEAKGDTLRVSWNGQAIIETTDGTFADQGKVGLWTKADSVTYFDDLTATPL